MCTLHAYRSYVLLDYLFHNLREMSASNTQRGVLTMEFTVLENVFKEIGLWSIEP